MSNAPIPRKSLPAKVQEHRAQLGLAVRVTIAAVLAFALSHLVFVPLPLWTVLTAVILTQVTFGRSVKATLDYLAGTVGGAIYAGAVSFLIPHANDFSLAGILAIVVAPLAFLGAVMPSFSAAPFTGVLVVLVPAFAHVGPIESAVDRVLEVAVGCITALAVSLLVFPARAHSVAIEAAARALELMAKLLPELFQGFLRPLDSASIQRIQDSIGQAVAQTNSIADEAKHERIGLLAAQPDLGSLRRTLLRLRHDFVMFARAAAEPLSEALQARVGPLLLRIAEGAADHLRGSAEALAARREPETAEAAFDECARMIATLRDEGLTLSLPVDAAERLFTLGFALEQMISHATIRIQLSEIAEENDGARILTLPWTRPSPYRKREIIQGANDAKTYARPMPANARAILIEALRDAHRWLDELLSDPRLTLESLASREGQDSAFDPDDLVARFSRTGDRQGGSRRTPAARLWPEASRRPADGLAGSMAHARTPGASASVTNDSALLVCLPATS
jgi:hypothetical protein